MGYEIVKNHAYYYNNLPCTLYRSTYNYNVMQYTVPFRCWGCRGCILHPLAKILLLNLI